MRKPGDREEDDGSRFCFRSVEECSEEPIAGEWVVTLECEHKTTIPTLFPDSGARPLGTRCSECEAEEE